MAPTRTKKKTTSKAPAARRPRKRAPRRRTRRELLLIACVAGVGVLVYIPSTFPCQTLGGGWLMLAATAVFYAGLLGIVSWQSRKRDWTKSMLYAAAVSGVIGAPGIAGGGIALLNYWLDGTPREQVTKVLSTTAQEGRGQTRYFVELAPWPPLDDPVEILVNQQVYNAAGRRDADMILDVGDGFFGIPWLKNDAGMAAARVRGPTP